MPRPLAWEVPMRCIGGRSRCDQGAGRKITGSTLVDEDHNDMADVVVLWFREEHNDGDLNDALLDALALLETGSPIWLLTPKRRQPGSVESSDDIGEASTSAGLSSRTTTLSVDPDWAGNQMVSPKAR